MQTKHITLFASLLTTLTLAGCGLDELDTGSAESFRSVTVSDAWGLHDDVSFPEVNSCVDYWNDRCANLTPSQCTVAKNRYSCTQNSIGVTVSDTYGVLVTATQWSGYSLGDDGPITTSGDPRDLCGELVGLDYEACLGLGAAAELAESMSDELLATFPAGGFASLTIRDDVFTVESFTEGGEDIVYTTAEALNWRVPVIEGELPLGSAGGAVLPAGTVLTVRPNGTVSVTCGFGGFTHHPRPPKQPVSSFNFSYSMSAAGANYNTPLTLVVGGWARYAAMWKAYVDQNVGSVDLYSTYGGSNLDIVLGAEHDLNNHESQYFTDIWGSQYDPNGIWMSVDIDDPLTGIAYAAIVMHYWHSPVFFSGDWQPPLSVAPTGAWYPELALEQLSFNSPTFTSLHDACGISPTTPATSALTQIQSCNFAGVSLTGGVVTAWLGDYSPLNAPPLLHHQTIAAADLFSAYAAGFTWSPGYPSGRVGELIFDPPPEADEEEVAAVLALATIMADELRAQVEFEELVE